MMIGDPPVAQRLRGEATAAARQPQRTAAALLPSLMSASERGTTFCI